MVVQAYAVCIGVTPECRQTESEMIGDGQGHVDEADKAYHDNEFLLDLHNLKPFLIATTHEVL